MTAPLLPPELWQQIAAFLDARNSGQVVISVTRGRITGFAITATWPVTEHTNGARVVDIGEGDRRVQSAQ